MLIADDRVTIIGSANINDRSMLGSRDSEVAVIIEDEEFDDYTMNNQSFKSGKFSGSLRRMLMREHLGIHKNSTNNNFKMNHLEMMKMIEAANDPVCDEFWFEQWNATAKLNTLIYEEVFSVIPTNEVKCTADIEDYLQKPKLYKEDKNKALERLTEIKGHLVFLPLDFLIDEPHTNYSTQDHFIPQIVWT